jgi:hypothetical protein
VGYKKERKSEREPDPILKLRKARLHAEKVIERDASEKDGISFAPQVSILWKIVDDGKDGDHNDTKFWDKYSFVKSFEDDSEYVIREDTRIGDLAAFVAYDLYDGADFFEDDIEIDFDELEGVEVIAQLEPRRFKDQDPTGTRTVSKTLQLAERAEKVAAQGSSAAEEDDLDEEDWDNIPF